MQGDIGAAKALVKITQINNIEGNIYDARITTIMIIIIMCGCKSCFLCSFLFFCFPHNVSLKIQNRFIPKHTSPKKELRKDAILSNKRINDKVCTITKIQDVIQIQVKPSSLHRRFNIIIANYFYYYFLILFSVFRIASFPIRS